MTQPAARRLVTEATAPAIIDGRLANNASVVSAATTAASNAVATAGIAITKAIAYTPQGATFLFADKNGNLSDLGIAPDGSVAEETAQSLYSVRGMPRVFTASSDGGVDICDTNGNLSVLGFDFTGHFRTRARWAIANSEHYYRGPEQPEPHQLYPNGAGGFITWDKTDGAGNLVDDYERIVRWTP